MFISPTLDPIGDAEAPFDETDNPVTRAKGPVRLDRYQDEVREAEKIRQDLEAGEEFAIAL